MKKTISILAAALMSLAAIAQPGPRPGEGPQEPVTKHGDPDEKVLIAYVFGDRQMPDPTYLTHINYAFGHVNETFDGVLLHPKDSAMLMNITALKKDYPHLKVLLSIGGWGSGRFSEMVTDPKLRMSFAKDCKRVVDEFDLDGIDIDWEYPTSNAAKISCAPTDTDNYTLMMRDIRKCIGKDKLLTQATVANARFIDFKAVDKYIDYTNAMTYDLGNAPYHNSTLHRSGLTQPNQMSVEEGILAHLSAGVPKEKLVLGMPFYGHVSRFFPRRGFNSATSTVYIGYTYHWDPIAKVPYLTDDETGEMVNGFEDQKSLYYKAKYALDMGLKGAMYWAYNGDTPAGDYRRTVYQVLNGLDCGLVLQKPAEPGRQAVQTPMMDPPQPANR